jgi:putative addiction module killer protein
VEATPKIITAYETASGKKPFEEWVEGLDHIVASRVEARINRLIQGNLGDVKPVGEGVSELRLAFGSGFRVYFAQFQNEIIVLLCGGDKSSQSKDIEIAHNYWADFKRRNND